jgi:hypothetical protein
VDTIAAGLLIVMLGSPHFGTRQAADEALARMGDQALPVLLVYDRDPDPELRRRVGRLIEARKPAMIERLLARHRQVPRIDALPMNYPQKWELINNRYGCYVPDGPEGCCYDWQEPLRQVTRELVTDLLYAGTSYSDVADLLERMAAREAKEWNGLSWQDE